MKVDLHIHSTASDGELKPEELVDLAISKKLKAIAITDHEVVDGAKKAIKYSIGKKIEVIPGIEIGADDKKLGIYDIHILGLFIDVNNEKLLCLSKFLMKERAVQKKKMIKILNRLGYNITFKELKTEVGGINFGRPHIARILIRKYGEFKNFGDVFSRLLGESGAAFVRQGRKSIKETIKIIHGAGGVAILAHPMLYKNPEKIIDEFIKMGGDGVESDYTYFDRGRGKSTANKMISRIRKIAKEKNLVVSGGGDFHSKNDVQQIGDCGLSEREFKKLKEYWIANENNRS